MDAISIELVETERTFLDLSEQVRGGHPPSDLDESGSSRLIGEIEQVCRKEQGTWEVKVERDQKVDSTGYGEELGPRSLLHEPRKSYYPGVNYTEIITYLANLPTGAAVASVAYLIKEPLIQWLKNRGNRHVRGYKLAIYQD